MIRVGFLLKVKEEYVEEYKAHHKKVWLEMQTALSRNGWKNYSLFIRPDGLLFGYFEASESFESSRAGMSTEEINTKWQTFMTDYFEDLPGLPDEGMVKLDQVFYLE